MSRQQYESEVLAEIEAAEDELNCAACTLKLTGKPVIQRSANTKQVYPVHEECADVYATIPI